MLPALEQLTGGDSALAFLTGYPEETAKDYGVSLRWFLSWCERHEVSPLAIRPYHFDLMLREMTQRWKPRTVMLRQVAVRGFYRYLAERGEIETVPIPDGWKMKLPKAELKPAVLTEEELDRFKVAARSHSTKAAVVSLLMTDLWWRVGQVCEATVQDFPVNPEGNIEVTGAAWGSIYRTKTVRGGNVEMLVKQIGGRTAGPLLVNEAGNPITRANVQRVLDRVTKTAGLPRVTPNDVRKAALAYSLGGYQGELRPGRLRSTMSDELIQASQVDPVTFAKELLSMSDVLLDDMRTRPVAPVVLSGTAIEHFLRRLALVCGSTSGGGGIEAWASSLRSLGIISKQEKKMVAVWSGLRDIAVHDDDTSPLTITAARHLNVQLMDFIETHESRFRT